MLCKHWLGTWQELFPSASAILFAIQSIPNVSAMVQFVSIQLAVDTVKFLLVHWQARSVRAHPDSGIVWNRQTSLDMSASRKAGEAINTYSTRWVEGVWAIGMKRELPSIPSIRRSRINSSLLEAASFRYSSLSIPGLWEGP